MPGEIQEFTNPQELIDAYDKLAAGGDFFIVYMTGGINADTGKSWCPDCDQVRSIITEQIIEKTNFTVLKGVVTERNDWVGVSTHPWKTHNVFKVGGIPSISLLQGAQVLMRAEDLSDFDNGDLMTAIANS